MTSTSVAQRLRDITQVRRARGWIPVVALAAVGVVGAILMFVLTRNGPGLYPDSATYVRAARDLLRGRGFASFPPRIMPLYPTVLAIVGILTRDIIVAARWVAILSFGGTVFLAARLVATATRSVTAGVAAAALLLTSVRVIAVYPHALTEALFLFLVVSSLYLLYRFLEDPSRGRLIACGLVVGLTASARYTGGALVLLGLAVVGLRPAARVRERIVHSAVFLGPAVVLSVGWLARNRLVSGKAIGRGFTVQIEWSKWISEPAQSLGRWLLPGVAVTLQWLLLAAAAIALSFMWRSVRRVDAEPPATRSLPWMLGMFVVAYVGTVLLAFTLVAGEGTIGPNLADRLLSPIFVVAVLLGVTVASRYVLRGRHWFGRVSVVGVGVALLVTSSVWVARGMPWTNPGFGYAKEAWFESPLLTEIERLERKRVVTNMPDLVYLLADRPATMLPRWYDTSTGQRLADYPREMRQLSDRVRRGDTVVAHFLYARRFYLAPVSDLRRVLPFATVRRFRDGVLLSREGR